MRVDDKTDTLVDDILAHHGVKGQRWGVRRSAPTAKVTVTQKGKKLKSQGGAGHKPSADAVKVQSLRQVRKKSGVHALSNEELQAYSKRLNLEQNVRQLEVKQPGAKNWIKRHLTSQGDQAASTAGQAARSKAVKKVFVAGAAAA
jgi:hypothetical protein